MTLRDEIERGPQPEDYPNAEWTERHAVTRQFALRIVRLMGEECARICHNRTKDWSPTEDAKYVALETARDCEQAIRAFGETRHLPRQSSQ